jgi:hypothetical protein
MHYLAWLSDGVWGWKKKVLVSRLFIFSLRFSQQVSGQPPWIFARLFLLVSGFPLKKFDAVGAVLKKVGLNQV